MATRIIHFSNENGSREGVFITDDLKTSAEDFVPFGTDLQSDETYEEEMPSGFPINYALWRE